MKVIKDQFTAGRTSMVSAVGQQYAVTLWEYVIDKDGTHWFWPKDGDEPGAMVHCGETIMAGKRSGGYGGRTLDFLTKDGVIQIQGPWHSNTDALYERTGVDLRDKHRTFGVISLGRGAAGCETVLIDIVHCDPDGGVVGAFDRIDKLARTMSDDNEMVLFYYRQSRGGSSCGPVYPSKWTEQQCRGYFQMKE